MTSPHQPISKHGTMKGGDSEMRIVLLGYRYAGKSSSGNTILGSKVFETVGRTVKCMKRKRETARRHITAVEAPGWRKHHTVEQSPEREKREIALSVSLCPPGPHALLLVINVSYSFEETHRRAVQGHMELLGERVWSHTIVLFTRGDWLEDTTIEQHIESGGEALQWVVEKCGNRYHVLNNRLSEDGQVMELLLKIEEMVAGNGGHHFHSDSNTLKFLKEEQEGEERRTEERKMKVLAYGQSLRLSSGGIAHISNMRIVLLGYRYAGKSSSGNTILGGEEFATSGKTAECVKREKKTAGRHITVVETPGWWRSYTVQETPEHDKEQIILSVSLCPPGPHAVLLVIKLSVSFTELLREAVQEHVELLGERVWSHTIVLFTRGDWLGDTTIEQHIESGGEALQWVVEKCGSRYHVIDSKKSDSGQVTRLLEKIEEMVAGNSGSHFDIDKDMVVKRQEKKQKSERVAGERMMKMETSKSSGDDSSISGLRIVLLGNRYAGKTSSGNTILGRNELDTVGRPAECVKTGYTAGRQLTIVEAPGWWKNDSVVQTPKHVKREIVLSMSQCPPGPHALLLVINVSEPFTEKHRKVVQEHLDLLGERVWNHTMVLFTHGDCQGNTTIEQHIESRGIALQWLVDRCGTRYHAVNNSKNDGGRVAELLEKIEEMLAGNSGYYFKSDSELLKKLQGEKKRQDRGAGRRRGEVLRRTQTLSGSIAHILGMRIVLLGYRNAGKRSSANTILGKGDCYTSTTAECVKREGEAAGRHITVVEAPGWWRNDSVGQTYEHVKQEIVLSVSLCPSGPHALLLVINLSTLLTEKHKEALQEHLELLGKRVWNHTMVLFTYGDWLGDTTIEQHIESEGEALQWVVEKCGNRYHVIDNNKCDDNQVAQLLEKIDEMVAGNNGNLFDFDNDMVVKLQEKKQERERVARKRMIKKQMETPRSSGEDFAILHRRIVLLGNRKAGKSSSGNTILGREAFNTSGRTAECVKREGEIAGGHITVVEAPGWWKNYSATQTPERDKREIVLSVSLCPPGPHALLLVVDVSRSFTEAHRSAIQDHLELLDEKVWSHILVLFTKGDWLGDTTIKQHIDSGGEALQWVVKKCGMRYHVLNNRISDGGQVTELLEKIEEIVAGNNGYCFSFDVKILKELTERKQDEERTAEERKMKVKMQRETLRSSTGGDIHISEMRIVLLGSRREGKSSSGNTILGRKEFNTSGRTATCVKREGETAGRNITVVEAPGWWKNYSVEQTPEHDKQNIVRSVSLCPQGPHALLLVVDVSQSFTKTHRRTVQEYLELLGERVWSHTIVLFTRGDWLGDTTIEQHIESGGEALQWVVQKCENRYHFVNNKKRDCSQVTELVEKIEEMVAGNRGSPFQLKQSIRIYPNFREHIPNDHSGGRSGKLLRVAASTQSSGYGTGVTKENSGSKEMPTVVKKIHGGGEIAQKDVNLGKVEKRLSKKDAQGKIQFVDASTITVNYNECIGKGSYGTVYRGSYQGTPAAVKIMSIGDSITINEFIIPLRLSHPNIVQIKAVAKSETEVLIANDYIHGANLHEVIHKAIPIKLQCKEKLLVALDIARAVEYIHGKQIIHQDLKPANIMIAADNRRAYLTDWGLANCKGTVIMTNGQKTGPLSGPLGGTPSYMAPECLVECKECSTMSDMWSLGITLLEMFTNCKPWKTSDPRAIRELLYKRESPHALVKLHNFDDILRPLFEYDPNSRMNANDLVVLLKLEVDGLF